MCTLPLVVFLIASTPAQSAQCVHARTHTHTRHTQMGLMCVKNAHKGKIHAKKIHNECTGT